MDKLPDTIRRLYIAIADFYISTKAQKYSSAIFIDHNTDDIMVIIYNPDHTIAFDAILSLTSEHLHSEISQTIESLSALAKR